MPSKLRERLSGIVKTFSTDRSHSRRASSTCLPEKSFISKYLDGELDHIQTEVPVVDYARDAGQLPEVPLALCASSAPRELDPVLAAYTGPDGGLTAIAQPGAISASSECLSSQAVGDIDYIDASSAASSSDSVRQSAVNPVSGCSAGNCHASGIGSRENFGSGGNRTLVNDCQSKIGALSCLLHGVFECNLCSEKVYHTPFPPVLKRKLLTTLSLPVWSSAPPSPPLMSPPVLCEQQQCMRQWDNSSAATQRNCTADKIIESCARTNGGTKSVCNAVHINGNNNSDDDDDDDESPGTFYTVRNQSGIGAANCSISCQNSRTTPTNEPYISKLSHRKTSKLNGRNSDHNGNFSGDGVTLSTSPFSNRGDARRDENSPVSIMRESDCRRKTPVSSASVNGDPSSFSLMNSSIPCDSTSRIKVPSNVSDHRETSGTLSSSNERKISNTERGNINGIDVSTDHRPFSTSTNQIPPSSHVTDSHCTDRCSDVTKATTPADSHTSQRIAEGLGHSAHDSHRELSSVDGKNQDVNQPASNDNIQPMSNEEVLAANADREFASVYNWNRAHDRAFGSSISLYERSYSTGRQAGSPIADVFGVVARSNSGLLAVADGVNWGSAARTAARSAVHGCLDYLNRALYGPTSHHSIKSSNDVFLALLRSFHSAHGVILQQHGMLTTLTAAVVLPCGVIYNNDDIRTNYNSGDAAATYNNDDVRVNYNSGDATALYVNNSAQQKYLVCVCNVGDSLAYVYSEKHGVREITRGSHDVYSVRDMRDALGALGPVTGRNPELNNLTLAMTQVESGDIVFLCSDGVSDNFDPVVGKFVSAKHSMPGSEHNQPVDEAGPNQPLSGSGSTTSWPHWRRIPVWASGKLQSVASGVRRFRLQRASSASLVDTCSPRDRGHRAKSCRPASACPSTLPSVSAYQRHELTLLRMNDVLRHCTRSDSDWCTDDDTTQPVRHARHLCGRLLNFVSRLTDAKRAVLEDPELGVERAIDGRGGVRVGGGGSRQWSKQEQLTRRRMLCDQLAAVPGKLDHATVVAYQVGSLNTPLPHETAL